MNKPTVAAAFTFGLALTGALAVHATPPSQDTAATMEHRAVVQSDDWRRLGSLVGSWKGWMEEGGKRMDASAEIRMTGDGSALMHVLGPDTPFEMVTMFHPDGTRLLLTHYCAAHNQPRMASVPAKAPNQVAFEFIDGTNIKPGDGYMASLVITFIDADHHDEAWAYRTKDGMMPATPFHFERVRK